MMDTEPAVSCEPCNVSEAVAEDPVDATRLAEPRDIPCTEKVTVPAGALPLEFVTVAVRVVLPVDWEILCGLAVTLMEVAGPDTVAVDHDVARLYASTDPSPVARS
jgi:hypothetical protein